MASGAVTRVSKFKEVTSFCISENDFISEDQSMPQLTNFIGLLSSLSFAILVGLVAYAERHTVT